MNQFRIKNYRDTTKSQFNNFPGAKFKPLAILVFLCSTNSYAIEAVYDGSDGILQQVFPNCLNCHSSQLSGSARQGAPSSVNFDTYAAAFASAERAVLRGAGGSMPPFGNTPLSDQQKNALLDWQTAGFPEMAVLTTPTATPEPTPTVTPQVTATPTPTPEVTPIPSISPTPIPTATPEPVNEPNLASLSAGLLLNSNTGLTESFDLTKFNAGVLKNNKVISSVIGNTDIVDVLGQILVSSSHQGQSADIIIVAAYKAPSANEVFFQKNADGVFVEWDGNPSHLLANQTDIELTAQQEINIYSGALIVGQFRVFFAYRLNVDQSIIFNATSFDFEVQ